MQELTEALKVLSGCNKLPQKFNPDAPQAKSHALPICLSGGEDVTVIILISVILKFTSMSTEESLDNRSEGADIKLDEAGVVLILPLALDLLI